MTTSLAAILILLSTSACAPEGPEAPETSSGGPDGAAGRPVSDTATLLEGKVRFAQEEEDGTVIEGSEKAYDAAVLAVPEKGGSGTNGHRLILVRALRGAPGAVAALDRLEIDPETGAGRPGERPLETEAASGEADLVLPLAPLHALPGRPPFRAPDAGSEPRASEEELQVVPDIFVEARVEARTTAADGKRVVRRALAGDTGPEFDFIGYKARLTEWSESYTIDPERDIIEKVARKVVVAVDTGGRTVLLESDVDLALSHAWTRGGEGADELGKALDEVGALERALEERKPSSEVAPRIEAFEKRVAETPLAALGAAMSSRLEGYRGTFEETAEGRALAKVLGREAPDFTLEDLDGKDVSFRSLSRGKVTLLTFWGVG